MGLRVNTNLFSLNAQRNLSNVSQRLSGNFARLSSGLRIASASDDAAGLGISERMRAQVRSLNQAGRNTQDGISMIQTAEGALGEVSANLIRARELAVQASTGTLSTGDRTALNTEFSAILTEIARVASETEFNGNSLLNTSASIAIQVGIDSGDTISATMVDTTTTTLGLDATTLGLTTASNAMQVITDIDSAIDTVTSARGSLGAVQNTLQSTLRSIQGSAENLTAAESRIRDVDVAHESADLTRNSILQQAALSVLAQANLQPQLALSLLG